jgi:bacterioferritin-associated ferredoxin
VSIQKLENYLKRENPTVASQLSECLGAGTSCGWCIPFLEKMHKLHGEGKAVELGVSYEKYTSRRKAHNEKNSS